MHEKRHGKHSGAMKLPPPPKKRTKYVHWGGGLQEMLLNSAVHVLYLELKLNLICLASPQVQLGKGFARAMPQAVNLSEAQANLLSLLR